MHHHGTRQSSELWLSLLVIFGQCVKTANVGSVLWFSFTLIDNAIVIAVSLDLENKKDSLIKATLDVILVKQNIDSVEGIPSAITEADKTPSVLLYHFD